MNKQELSGMALPADLRKHLAKLKLGHQVLGPNGEPTGEVARNARNARRLSGKARGKYFAKMSLRMQRAKGLR